MRRLYLLLGYRKVLSKLNVFNALVTFSFLLSFQGKNLQQSQARFWQQQDISFKTVGIAQDSEKK